MTLYFFLKLPFNHRKRSECAQWYVPLASQSELSLQHHPGIPGFSSQLWHREPHGFKRHYQDPQPSLQRVSVHACPTCKNQECWYGWTTPSIRKSSARSRWQSGVCEPPCRVQRWRWAHCPLSAKMYACDHRPRFVQLHPQLCSYCPSPPLSNRCISSIQILQRPSSSSRLSTPAHASLRPLHVKLPIVVWPNYEGARGKYDGLIQRG